MTNKLALLVAVVLGVLSILGIRFYVEKVRAGYEQTAQLVDVPVAAHDLLAGSVVGPNDVATRRFPRAAIDGLGASWYREDERRSLEGQKLLAEVKSGQVFQTYHFQKRGPRQGLRVGSGFRALTVPVNAQVGCAGMLRPGDSVDVVVSEEFEPLASPGLAPASGATKLPCTRTLLRKVPVLAVDASTDPDAGFADYTTVTLQLRSLDVNRLCHAIDHGSPIHMTKLDDAEQASPGEDAVWPEKSFHELEGEVTRKNDEMARERAARR